MTIVLRVHECMNTFFKSADNQYENTTDPPNDDWWLFLVVFQGGLHRSKWTFLNRFCMKVVLSRLVDLDTNMWLPNKLAIDVISLTMLSFQHH